MKKVLFILPDCLFKSSGGLGERFKNLVPYFQNKLDCYFFTNGYSGNYKGFPVQGLKQYNLFLGEPIANALCSSYIESFIDKKGKPDVIVSADHATIYPAFSVARHHNCKWIVEFDLALFSYSKQYDKKHLTELNQYQSYLIENCEKFGAENANQVVLCSDFYKNEIPYFNKNKEHVVVENGIDIKPYLKKLEKFNFSDKFKYNIAYIGRFSSQKGVQHLIDCKLPDNVALYFAGQQNGSNLYNEVIQCCQNSSNKFFVGEMTGDKKIQFLQSADAIIFPSTHEPFGIVGLEAMASKTLLITTMVDGIASYTNEELCLKIETGVDGVELGFKQFLKMTQKEKKIKIENSFQQVKKFSWKRCANKFIEIIENV
jgi:glycosyltransferase involved in cell wall biosynthesis